MTTLTIPTTRYRGINFPRNFNKTYYDDISCNVLDNIELLTRIGSDSLRAKVYEASINNVSAAIKVVKRGKSDHERYINKLIENPSYFLYMIDGVSCSINDYMIMEIAVSDVNQRLLYSDINQNDFNTLIDRVIICITELASLGIYHGDLHCGNVFYVMRDCEISIVLGDFGESMVSDSYTTSSSDLYCFINSLREKLLENICTRCNDDKVNNFISQLDSLYKIMSDVNRLFNKYENIDLDKNSLIGINIEYMNIVYKRWLSDF